MFSTFPSCSQMPAVSYLLYLLNTVSYFSHLCPTWIVLIFLFFFFYIRILLQFLTILICLGSIALSTLKLVHVDMANVAQDFITNPHSARWVHAYAMLSKIKGLPCNVCVCRFSCLRLVMLYTLLKKSATQTYPVAWNFCWSLFWWI